MNSPEIELGSPALQMDSLPVELFVLIPAHGFALIVAQK